MNELAGYDIEDLEVGQSATLGKKITEADIVLFAGASGDNNAMHINEEFAQTTQFKGRIAHGMLTASVISAAIAGRLPGPGTVYLRQSLRFKAPVHPGETVHATVTVKEIMREKGRVTLTTVCTVGGHVVIDGDALVMPTSRRADPRQVMAGLVFDEPVHGRLRRPPGVCAGPRALSPLGRGGSAAGGQCVRSPDV